MKKYIITVQEVQNNEYGDPARSLLKSGVLTAESHWDALKVARSLAKKVSRTRVYACESVEGTTMSAQAATVIDALKAEEYEEDE